MRTVPMMVIGQTPMGNKQVKVVELSLTAQEYLKGEQYPQALLSAFMDDGLVGAMVALTPEDAMLLTDGLATMKQCLLSTDSVVSIRAKANHAPAKNIAKIA